MEEAYQGRRPNHADSSDYFQCRVAWCSGLGVGPGFDGGCPWPGDSAVRSARQSHRRAATQPGSGRSGPLAEVSASATNRPEQVRILVGIRDEAHRFAITYHRKLREDRTLTSVLDAITGLGEKRKKALLKTFGTIEAIKAATVEALVEVPGMNRVVAERVLIQLKELDEEE